MSAYFGGVAHEQGWNTDTQVNVLRDFIVEHGLDRELGAYARERADEENRTTLALEPSHPAVRTEWTPYNQLHQGQELGS